MESKSLPNLHLHYPRSAPAPPTKLLTKRGKEKPVYRRCVHTLMCSTASSHIDEQTWQTCLSLGRRATLMSEADMIWASDVEHLCVLWNNNIFYGSKSSSKIILCYVVNPPYL